MVTIVTRALKNTHLLKLLAMVIGYTLWFIIASQQVILISFKVPIYFYNNFDTLVTHEPEYVQVTLKGKRNALSLLNKTSLGIHIDATTLTKGVQYISIEEQQLLLPLGIQLVHTSPASITITMK